VDHVSGQQTRPAHDEPVHPRGLPSRRWPRRWNDIGTAIGLVGSVGASHRAGAHAAGTEAKLARLPIDGPAPFGTAS